MPDSWMMAPHVITQIEKPSVAKLPLGSLLTAHYRNTRFSFHKTMREYLYHNLSGWTTYQKRLELADECLSCYARVPPQEV
jgi:hypothetical protein